MRRATIPRRSRIGLTPLIRMGALDPTQSGFEGRN
jgi:hypothetical protein